jgi:hypothetical protein
MNLSVRAASDPVFDLHQSRAGEFLDREAYPGYLSADLIEVKTRVTVACCWMRNAAKVLTTMF